MVSILGYPEQGTWSYLYHLLSLSSPRHHLFVMYVLLFVMYVPLFVMYALLFVTYVLSSFYNSFLIGQLCSASLLPVLIFIFLNCQVDPIIPLSKAF